MGITKSTKNIQHTPEQETVEVLYQKLGDRWYAFSLIDDEVFVGSINQEDINAVETKSKVKRKVPMDA
jgi:hypothetical protein